MLRRLTWAVVAPSLLLSTLSFAAQDDPLPGTQALEMQGDIASTMIDGIDAFLLAELRKSIDQRQKHWHRDTSSAGAYAQSVIPNRMRLAAMLGIRESRVADTAPRTLSTNRLIVGQSPHVEILEVQWPVFGRVTGAGLMLVPRGRKAIANVVAIPDAAQVPEHLAGLLDQEGWVSPFALRLAESGCRVIVPAVIDRERRPRAAPDRNARTVLTNREYLYRSAFELGRHLVGYESQKVMACIDWFRKRWPDQPVGVAGYGEGGLLSLYTAALDTRIDVALVSGYFGSRQKLWQEPIDRNVFGLLAEFGDAEVASLVAPRSLFIEPVAGPEMDFPGEGGAPAVLHSQPLSAVLEEFGRLSDFAGNLVTRSFRGSPPSVANLLPTGDVACNALALQHFLSRLSPGATVAQDLTRFERLAETDPAARHQIQMDELDDYNQRLLRDSPYVRAEFMKKLDTSSAEAYAQSVKWYRDYFREEVIGHFDRPLAQALPRTRVAYDTPKWTGYEVVLDVFPDVIAYGILCLPKNIGAGERRPVVVCQHGLEGRPQDLVSGDHRAYHDFAAKLAERGYITFAPQNIYLFRDRFRTLQRKANPLKKTLFSIMVPQHQQIVSWLATLPQVDPERIAFYGLSYGGKSAMRIPPLVDGYCLSICSADFNDWVRKCASNRSPYSYVWTGEYEIFEWDLGSTFNYAEMAALIAPRPFMVERGHFDGVAPDEWVAYEFAKVRHLYQAQLGIGERAEIEWFAGPHTINGRGTFAFLDRWLD